MDIIYNDWLTLFTLIVQGGILKFAYNLYRDYMCKEKIGIVQ